MKQCFLNFFFHTVACLQGYFIIVSKLIFWVFSDECLLFLKLPQFVLTLHNLFSHIMTVFTFFSAVFLCNIKKSSICESLGVWKSFRGVVKGFRAEDRVRIIHSFFAAVWMCQCYHSGMYYYSHEIKWTKEIILHAAPLPKMGML